MQTPHEQLTTALDLLTQALVPFVEEHLKAAYKDKWMNAATRSLRDDRNQVPGGGAIRWDAQAVLTIMWDHWNGVFSSRLGHFERSLISELREFRNRWAHQETFNFDDTFRVLDSVERLLVAVDASEAAEVARRKREVLEEEFRDEVNENTRRRQDARDKRVGITVYITCCVAIVMQLFNSLGLSQACGLAIVTIAFFAYMIRQRLVNEPVILGPRECKRCRRIVYSTVCPYCETSDLAQSMSCESQDTESVAV